MSGLAILGFWALAFRATLGRGNQRLLYLFFASLPFGSFAVVPTAATGGLTLTPAPMVALLVLLRCLLLRGGFGALLSVALARRGLLLLFLFWAVALVVTAFMPRVVAGRVDIIPFRGEMLGASPLYPSLQNLSQLSYLTISVFLTMAFAVLLRDPRMRRHCPRAICLGCVVAVGTGALDFASSYLPLTPLLDPFRTATYALLVSHEVLGAKRIVGLMPEASAYGSLCVGLLSMLYFFRRSIADDRLRDRVAPLLLAALALFVWLSTSTAAYLALILLGFLAAIEWGWRAAVLRRAALGRRGLSSEFRVACGCLVAIAFVVLFTPSALDPWLSLFDRMVLRKMESNSFAERGLWTATSWRAMLETGGIGVGVGSTRASSSVVGVVSGTGFLGALLYYGFVAQTLLRKAGPGDAQGAVLVSAARWSMPPVFATGLMIGISADFGPILAFLFGLSAAVAASGASGVAATGTAGTGRAA